LLAIRRSRKATASLLGQHCRISRRRTRRKLFKGSLEGAPSWQAASGTRTFHNLKTSVMLRDVEPLDALDFVCRQLPGPVTQAEALDIVVGEMQDRPGVAAASRRAWRPSFTISRLNSSTFAVRRSRARASSPVSRLIDTMLRPYGSMSAVGTPRAEVEDVSAPDQVACLGHSRKHRCASRLCTTGAIGIFAARLNPYESST